MEQKELSLREVQLQHKEWVSRNFPDNPSYAQLLGITEEVGELNHHVLKNIQKIRGSEEEHKSGIKDALADIIIYMCGFANDNNIDLQTELNKTWDVVKKRDWTKNKKTGEV